MEQHPSTPGGEKERLSQHETLAANSPQPELVGEQFTQPPEIENLQPDAPESVVSALAATVPAEVADRGVNEPTAERHSNKELLAVAKAGIEAVADQVRDNENMPGVRDLAEYFITSDSMHAPPHMLFRATAGGRLDLREVMATAADCAIFRLWSRSKVVYAMDDLLLGYLSEASSSPIPAQILEQLPHPDPYILLPKPNLDDPQTTYYRTHINLPVGAFVFGRYNQAQQLTSSADAKREDLGLMFLGFRDTDHGRDLITLRCTIPLQGPTFRVEDAVNATIAKFRFNDHLAEDDPAQLEAWAAHLRGASLQQPAVRLHRAAGHRGLRAQSRSARQAGQATGSKTTAAG